MYTKNLSKLHLDCSALFQKPRGETYGKSMICYSKSPQKVNAIGNLLSVIFEKAGLKTRYTKYCIRATTVTSLRAAGVAPSDILAVTGHSQCGLLFSLQ